MKNTNKSNKMENSKLSTSWERILPQYNIEGTRITDDFIDCAVKDEMEAFHRQLWGAWKLAEGEDDTIAAEIGEMVNMFYNLLAAVEKMGEFTRLFKTLLLQDEHPSRTIDPGDYRYIDVEKIINRESKD